MERARRWTDSSCELIMSSNRDNRFEATDEIIIFVSSLRTIGHTREFDSRISDLERFAKARGRDGGIFLAAIYEYLLRSNKDLCSYVGTLLRMSMEDGVIWPEDGLAILESWERHPVVGFDPNLGAGVYEHIIKYPSIGVLFAKWLEDPILRKRYIESAYALPTDAELLVYERSISLGEIDAVCSSLSTFLELRKFPSEGPTKERWENIRKICNL